MCGIYGSTKIYNNDIISKKLAIANFRGPDYSEFKKIDSTVVLGHNRLSIIDLDPRSNQPFFFNDISIVFNGEIYNYLTLKDELFKKGYIFKTDSDTEVICAAYKEYGNKCVDHLIGMFSFVIYDKSKNLLFGSRDRLGQKPFYYYLNDTDFEFASNLKQIEIANNLELDPNTCINYFHFGYFVDPQTPYKNVYKLKPGHSFEFKLDSRELNTWEYWDCKTVKPFLGNYQEAKEALKKLLLDAVKIRLQADVPLGLFLSGGVDSSLITALASKSSGKVDTFSIKFLEKEYDESKWSKEIAEYLGTEHHVFTCDMNSGLDLVNNFYKYYDEPFADVSSLPSMLLSNEVRKSVTVALTGDGADELFLGYDRYKWIQSMKPVYNIPYFLRKGISSVLQNVPNYKFRMLAKGAGYRNLNELYFKMVTTLKTEFIKKDVSPEYMDVYNGYLLKKNLLNDCSFLDTKVYLNSDINTKVDRASMAYSLETRSPFMDHRVAEFARSLPLEYKYKNGTLKHILKDILHDYVPKELFDRPKKGFSVPLEYWLKKELKPMVLENFNLFKTLDFDFINFDVAEKMIHAFYEGKENNKVEIWRIFMFMEWYRKTQQ